MSSGVYTAAMMHLLGVQCIREVHVYPARIQVFRMSTYSTFRSGLDWTLSPIMTNGFVPHYRFGDSTFIFSVMWCPIWVYLTVCPCLIKGTLGFYGINETTCYIVAVELGAGWVFFIIAWLVSVA